jgi:hypothetical protein
VFAELLDEERAFSDFLELAQRTRTLFLIIQGG